MRGVDFDDMSRRYDAGRVLTLSARRVWADAFTRYAPSGRPLSVLDLGSGTGRLTPLLADLFGGPVHGVEPSDGMRSVAQRDHTHPGVAYLPGRAERIPLGDASVDLALLYLSLHHFTDRAAAAAEQARVLRPDGRILVHGYFADRLGGDERVWYRYFPGLRAIEEERFPTLPEVLAEYTVAGLELVDLVTVPHRVADSLAAYHEKTRHRAFSTLTLLPDDEVEAGLARLAADAAAQTDPQPEMIDADLLVLAPV